MVATNIRGCRQVVDDRITGRLVPVRDPEALAAAVAELASSPELRGSYGAAGREKALREFDDRRCVEITLETYKMLMWKRAWSVAGQAS